MRVRVIEQATQHALAQAQAHAWVQAHANALQQSAPDLPQGGAMSPPPQHAAGRGALGAPASRERAPRHVEQEQRFPSQEEQLGGVERRGTSAARTHVRARARRS